MIMLKPSQVTQAATSRASGSVAAAVDATPAGVERNELPQPRKVLPLVPSDVAVRDWDDLFDAIAGRLTAMSAETGTTNKLRAGMLECVEAMGQLHAILAHERARNHQFELNLFDARAALAQARIELVGSRSDERRSRRLALHDELTSLPNRSFFGEWLDHALVQAEPLKVAFAVLSGYAFLDPGAAVNSASGRPAQVAGRLGLECVEHGGVT
jgi:hypothetical protein